MMISRFRSAANGALIALLLLSGTPAVAQEPSWRGLGRNLDPSQLEVLHPLIQAMLREDRVGDRRPWRSASGKHGFIRLESGGDQAKASEGVVAITIFHGHREMPFYTFRYRRDASDTWLLIG